MPAGPGMLPTGYAGGAHIAGLAIPAGFGFGDGGAECFELGDELAVATRQGRHAAGYGHRCRALRQELRALPECRYRIGVVG